MPTHDPEKVAEALKLADLADGVEDNIAHKCAGCALSMDGIPLTLDVNGTTLHLCASMCKVLQQGSRKEMLFSF